MKKGLKITLIVAGVVVVVLGATLGGTLLYTKNNITRVVGETSISSYIYPSLDSYFGYIVTETPIEISNNGLYTLQNLVITVIVTGQDFSLSFLNGLELGRGENNLGNIKKGESWSGTIKVNMTQNIATLAVQDGELKIAISSSVHLDLLLFKIPNTSSEVQIKTWDSPFAI